MPFEVFREAYRHFNTTANVHKIVSIYRRGFLEVFDHVYTNHKWFINVCYERQTMKRDMLTHCIVIVCYRRYITVEKNI